MAGWVGGSLFGIKSAEELPLKKLSYSTDLKAQIIQLSGESRWGSL